MFVGSGAHGQVYVKSHSAIKTGMEAKQVIREVALMRRCRAIKNVVTIKSFSLSKGQITMERYEQNLDNWARTKPSKIDIVTVLEQLFYGLYDIHKLNVVHSDIKPTNILIRTKPLSVAIGDFGNSSLVGYARSDKTSPFYRDPMQSKTKAHDIYSLGVCIKRIYYLAKKDNLSTKLRIDTAAVPKAYRKIVKRMLNKKPEARPTIQEIYHAFFGKRLAVHPHMRERMSINIVDDVFRTLPRQRSQSLSCLNNVARISPRDLKQSASEEWISHCVKSHEIAETDFRVPRTKIGCECLLSLIENYKTTKSVDHKSLIFANIIILAACFGGDFPDELDNATMQSIEILLSDGDYVDCIMT